MLAVQTSESVDTVSVQRRARLDERGSDQPEPASHRIATWALGRRCTLLNFYVQLES